MMRSWRESPAYNYACRVSSALKDPRMPWRVPGTGRYEMTDTMLLESDKAISLAFTVDFEYDGGSAGDGTSEKGIVAFLEKFFKFPAKIKGDFFVQGNLVKKYGSALQEIESRGFEIGLHGYEHELWGGPQWFLNDKFVSPAEREKRINLSMEAFNKSGLKIPKTFRAPNMAIDGTSLNLLKKYDFELDSSQPSYLGYKPLVEKDEKLSRIPVSCDPQPEVVKRMGIPFLSYKVLNLHWVNGLPNEELEAMIKRILHLQDIAGQKAQLVFLMHPWEFLDSDAASKLLNKLSFIEARFNIEYKNLNSICREHENL